MMTDKLVFGEKLDHVTYETRTGAYAIVFDAGRKQTALIRTPKGWFLPGGGIDEPETHEECLKRELLEETGWEVQVEAYVGTAARYFYSPTFRQHYCMDGYFYLARLTEWKQPPIEDDHELIWVPVEEAPQLLVHDHQSWAVRQAILQTTDPLDRVRAAVQQYDSSLEPLVFDEPLSTSEAAANALGVEVGQIAKSILFRVGERHGLFVAAGDVKIDPKQVRACLGGGKTKMASPEEVREITGFEVGAVCPFALRQAVPVFIDTSLQRFDHVYTAAGIRESVLPITYQQLLAITAGTEFAATTHPEA
jgi:prolyl-tRNA editing enzyme YbaK/EbsC (Cys-tRNA(Pro) deacylase)/8-oxo-dGTP pyrophosphatase MutT (NUDIX family)